MADLFEQADSMVGAEIHVDEDAFDKAIEDFYGLAEKLAKLKSQIEDLLSGLKTGFDTPAGRQLLATIDDNLYVPLEAQKLVIEHITETLRQAKEDYEPLFAEYENLQNTINQYNQN